MIDNQRTGLRIPLGLPVELRWKSRGGNSRHVEGRTGNISGNGLFMNIPVRPPCNTTVTMRVFLPSAITHVPVELLCIGRVVRWNAPGESTGMGATIDEYEFRRTCTHAV